MLDFRTRCVYNRITERADNPNERKEVKKMKEMIKNIGETAVIKMRIINRVKKDGEYTDNIRKCPTYSEFYGMIQTLKCMDIDFDIEWNKNDLDEMTAITIMGLKFEV